ncbi:MAG: transcriptional regulator GcvA [Alphaproteobacteria bacterium]|nr:transcriptional regulator GcvA [Alphaproteobacteria bacterium]
MKERLPPLNALRAFEAAARHRSFTRAADELCVTPGAVSRAIKALEEDLGRALFLRHRDGLALTEAGQGYLPAVEQAFAMILDGARRLRQGGGPATVALTTLPSFATKWLAPRLGALRARHPDIDLQVHTSYHMVDLARDHIDCALRYGRGGWEGVQAERLMGETVSPVCAPALAALLREPADLAGVTLLHPMEPDVQQNAEKWGAWLEAAGVAGIDVERGPRFYDSAVMLQAAIEGQGVAMGRSALTAIDVAAGRLVRPFALELPSSFDYWFVARKGPLDPPLARFREWLFEQAAAGRGGGPS